MKKKIFKLLIFGIFIFLAFDINVKANATPYYGYLWENNLDNLEVYQSTGTLNVTGVYSSETFEAHKILDVYYNLETNEMLYAFTSTFYDFLFNQGLGINSEHPFTVDDYFALTSGDITNGSTITTSELDLLMSNYAAYIKQNSITGLNMAVSYQVASLTAEAGAYLVLPTTTDKVYSVMVGNLDMYADGTEWKVNDETIVAKTSEVNIEMGSTNLLGESISTIIIGRKYIVVTEINAPIYPTNATNKKLTLKETLESGITFDGLQTIKLESGSINYSNNNGVFTDENGNIVATATFIEQVLTIEFNTDYLYTPDINVSYSARLNENANIGYGDNLISTELTFSNDPYGTSTTTKESTEFMHTFGVQIYKYDVDDNSPLNGAVFEIYNDEELTDLIGTITTDETGIGRFAGVEDGSIYLKEIKAPTGYKLMRDIITISELAPTAIEDEVQIEIPNGYRMAYIPNEKMGILPVTGGIGTVIYTIIGLITIAGSISFISIYKSKKNNENFQV